MTPRMQREQCHLDDAEYINEQAIICSQEQQHIYQQDNYDLDLISSPSQYLQFDTRELINKILDEVKQISNLTTMGFDWSFMLYATVLWKKEKYEELILRGQDNHQKIIGYQTYFNDKQGFTDFNFCPICLNVKKMVRNICGHEFCQICWKNQIHYRADKATPFPPCIQADCQSKMSFTLCQILYQNDNILQDIVTETICKSYAEKHPSVIVCKGRPGYNCNRIFKRQTKVTFIECENCGNLVCTKCGQEFHGTIECQMVKQWEKCSKNTLGFVEYLNMQMCPRCNHAVQRVGGCNKMYCLCKQIFCYVCGNKWNQSHPFYSSECPLQQQIKKKSNLRRKMNTNKQKITICQRIETKRIELKCITVKIAKINQERKKIPSMRKVFINHFKFHQNELKILDQMCSFLNKAYLLLWGEAVRNYFFKDDHKDFFANLMSEDIHKIYQIIFQFVNKMYEVLLKTDDLRDFYSYQDQNQLNNIKNKNLQSKNKFSKLFFQKVKEMQNYKHRIVRIAKQDLEFSHLD